MSQLMFESVYGLDSRILDKVEGNGSDQEHNHDINGRSTMTDEGECI